MTIGYSAVVFDMDGVIFDTENLRLDIMQTIALRRGMKDVVPLYNSITGTTETETKRRYLEYYGGDFPYDEVFAQAKAMEHEYMNSFGPPLKPGVRELLAYLKRNGKLIALASSGDMADIRLMMGMAGIMADFDAIISGDSIARSKPAPDIYLAAARAIGVEPGLCFAVEDAYHGIHACYDAGMTPIFVPDRLPPTDEIRALCAAVCPSLTAVQKYLESL